MRNKPNRATLPDGDIATVRAALRAFAREGSPAISDEHIDAAIEEISRIAINPTKIGPIAEKAKELLANLSKSALSCSNSLKALDTHMKRMISFEETNNNDDLDISFEPLATYSDIDGIQENETRTESSLVLFLIEQLQLLHVKTDIHITRISEKYDLYDSIYRYGKRSSAQIIVFNCCRLIYKSFGFASVSLITPTPPSPKKHYISDFYRLVLATHNFTFNEIYDPFKRPDIFTAAIKDLITKDESAIRKIFG